ncbi:hypothetical protein EAO73_14695 [Streptomyces sp. col6]|nr:hypothetical protein EAO73_14695 [Streptomyces sp. col6]
MSLHDPFQFGDQLLLDAVVRQPQEDGRCSGTFGRSDVEDLGPLTEGADRAVAVGELDQSPGIPLFGDLVLDAGDESGQTDDTFGAAAQQVAVGVRVALVGVAP